MGLSFSLLLLPSSLLSSFSNKKIDAAEEEINSEEILSKLLHFTGPYRRQTWSLPDSVIYYIAKKPKSPELYQKIIKTCKYFFSKNPIIVCSTLSFTADLDFYNSETDDFDGEETIITKMYIDQNGRELKINENNITQKLWIPDAIYIDTNEIAEMESVVSSIVSNIYRCDAKEVNLCDLVIPRNEYVLLASNAEKIHLVDIAVKDEDGSIVPLEKLVEVAINAHAIDFDNEHVEPNISSDTVKNLLQIPHFSSLQAFSLSKIPESFDIDTFFTYIKKNKHAIYLLHFSYSSLSDPYIIRLNEIVDEIISTEPREYRPPCFIFEGHDNENQVKLREIFRLSLLQETE